MMRNCIVLALFVAATAAAGVPYYHPKTADLDYLQKQKKVFELLAYVDPIVHTDAEYYEIGYNFDIYGYVDYFLNKEVVYDFFNYYKNGLLSKDAIFTYYNQEHREEMMSLYRMFYFAKDFETFYKVACWARVHVNHGMFVTAFTSAVIYREDTKYIRLPAIYEIYPNLFFDSKVIRDAQRIKMTRGNGFQEYKHNEEVETYYLYSNASEMCVSPFHEYEYRLNYFMEDVDLNAWYYYFRMAYPFWMDTKDYNMPKTFRGDFYYFFHHQLMSRYYLERFSHGFTSLEDFSWDRMELPGYYGDYVYANGIAQPKRDWWNVVPFYKYRYVELIKQFEQRIYEAIDAGYFFDEAGNKIDFYTPEGLNYLGNLIEGNCDSYNIKYFGAYDVLARDILGMNFDCNCKDYYVPSSLEYFTTSLKDPAFYRLYDRIMSFFHRYKANLKRYTKTELDFPGVKFEHVEVDRLVTFFDKKDYYINNAVSFESWKEGNYFNIRTWKYHLDYKPFTYKFTINSEKETKAVLRIFLGPAIEGEYYDNYSYLLHYYKYFYMLDEFELELQAGVNTFERHSSESYFFKKDYYSADYYYKQVLKAIEGGEAFTYSERMFSFPDHLMLPRGTVEGMRFKLFFYIGPYEDVKLFEVPFFGNFKFYGKSFGFPLDRPMYPWFFQLDNCYFKDVFIYHEKFEGKYEYPKESYNTEYYKKDYDTKYYPHKEYEGKYYKDFPHKEYDAKYFKDFPHREYDAKYYKDFPHKEYDAKYYKDFPHKEYDAKYYKDFPHKEYDAKYYKDFPHKEYDAKYYKDFPHKEYDTKYYKDFTKAVDYKTYDPTYYKEYEQKMFRQY